MSGSLTRLARPEALRVIGWMVGLLLTLTVVPVASGRVPNACTLLKNSEVVDALGAMTKHRTARAGSDWSACAWHDEPLTSAASVRLNLQVIQMPKAVYARKVTELGTAKPVHGLGTLAYAFQEGETVTVWYRGIVLTVIVRGAKAPLQTATRVARDALARL